MIVIVPTLATIGRMIMSIKNQNDTLFSTGEAASYLGYAEDTIRRYIYRGLINSAKLGNSLVITKSECDRFKREKRSAGRPKNNS